MFLIPWLYTREDTERLDEMLSPAASSLAELILWPEARRVETVASSELALSNFLIALRDAMLFPIVIGTLRLPRVH